MRIAEALQRQGALRCDKALLQRLQIGVGDGSQPGVAADAAPGTAGTTNTDDRQAAMDSHSQEKDPGSRTLGQGKGREAGAAGSSHGGHDNAWEQAAGVVQAHCQERCREEGETSLIPGSQQQQQPPSGQEGGAGSSQQGRSQGDGCSHECSSEGSSPADSTEGDGEDAVPVDEHLLSWMRDISEGHNFLLTPSQWAAQLAPHLPPQRSAELYTGEGCSCMRLGCMQGAWTFLRAGMVIEKLRACLWSVENCLRSEEDAASCCVPWQAARIMWTGTPWSRLSTGPSLPLLPMAALDTLGTHQSEAAREQRDGRA